MSLLLFCFFVRQNVSQQFLNPKRSLESVPLTAPPPPPITAVPPPMVTIPCYVPSQGCASECSFHPEEGYSSYHTTWCWTDQAHRFWKDCDCHAPEQGGVGDICDMRSMRNCLGGLECIQALGQIGDLGTCGVRRECPIIDGCSPGFTTGSVNGCPACVPAQGGPGDSCNMNSTSPCLPGLNCLQALGRIGDWGNCGVPDPAVNCPIIDGCSAGFTIGSVNGCPACVPEPIAPPPTCWGERDDKACETPCSSANHATKNWCYTDASNWIWAYCDCSPPVNCPIIDGCSAGFTVGSENGCPACVPVILNATDVQ